MIIKAHYIMHALALIDSLLVHSVEIMMHGKIAEARSQNSSRTHATCEGIYAHRTRVRVLTIELKTTAIAVLSYLRSNERSSLLPGRKVFSTVFAYTDICSAATFRGAIISAMSSVRKAIPRLCHSRFQESALGYRRMHR